MSSCMCIFFILTAYTISALAMDNIPLFPKSTLKNTELQWIVDDVKHTQCEFAFPSKKNTFIQALPTICSSPYHIACGDNLNALFVTRKDKKNFKRLPSTIEGPITSMTFDCNGKELIVGYSDMAHRWNFLQKRWKNPLFSFNHHLSFHSFDTLSAHPSNDSIIASGSSNGSVTLWNLEQKTILNQKILDKPIKKISFNTRGNILAILSASKDRHITLSLWNIEDDAISSTSYIDNPFGHTKNIIFSPDDSLLAMLENQQCISWCSASTITNERKSTIYATQLPDIELDTLFFGKNNVLLGLNKHLILLLDVQKNSLSANYNKQYIGYSCWQPNTHELILFKYFNQQDAVTADFYDFSPFYKKQKTLQKTSFVYRQIQASFQAREDLYENLIKHNASEKLLNLFNKTLAEGDFITNIEVSDNPYSIYVQEALRVTLHKYLALKIKLAYKRICVSADENIKKTIKSAINENATYLQAQLNMQKNINLALWCNRKKLMDSLLNDVGTCPFCLECYKDIMKYGKAGIMLQLICRHRLCQTCWQNMPKPGSACHICRGKFILNLPSLDKLASSRVVPKSKKYSMKNYSHSSDPAD